MQTLLIILIVFAVIATVVMLVRGIIAFLQTTEADLKGEGGGPSEASLRQNKMMMRRIQFQGLAVVFVILLLALAKK